MWVLRPENWLAMTMWLIVMFAMVFPISLNPPAAE
jgi:hypothetical protein